MGQGIARITQMDTNKIAKIFIIRSGSILLLHSVHNNKWHLPGGHVQQNETFEYALKREVVEETGCELKFYHRIRLVQSNICLFIGKLQTDKIILSNEHSGYAWVPLNKAMDYDVCKFTFRDIRYLQTIIGFANEVMSQ